MKNFFKIVLIATLFFSCGSDKTQENPADNSTDNQPQQFNISILLDLSDRINDQYHPEQRERDIQIVSAIIDIFKNKMLKDGAFLSKSKMQILFSPAPADPNVNNIAKNLSVDLSKVNNKKKREIFDNIEKDFEDGLKEIYQLTLQNKNWIGSDIWRFFKYDANELCIDKNPNCRNILVIVTDGYLYHIQSKDRQLNRTAFINEKYLQSEGLRIPNWRDKFKNGDYGFINSGKTFENLEVIVLGINPSNQYKNDEDIIRAYIGKWFDEMKIKNKVLYNTDLPTNTQKRIENFFKD